MNVKNNDSLAIVEKLYNLLITCKKNQIKREDLRIVMIGNERMLGLIPFALKTDNYLVCRTILRAICQLLDAEICSLSDAFQKVLEDVPCETMRLQKKLHSHEQYILDYFKIIEIYTGARHNKS